MLKPVEGLSLAYSAKARKAHSEVEAAKARVAADAAKGFRFNPTGTNLAAQVGTVAAGITKPTF